MHAALLDGDGGALSFRFYLGTHERSWLWDPRFDGVPLFVSRRRLARNRRKVFPRAMVPWALDSGGFTELLLHGRWTLTPAEYLAEVRSFIGEIGAPDWVAPMDWMCEPWILEKTGLSVEQHQQRTVENLLELRALAPELRIVPVLQGFTEADYVRCVELYDRAGVKLLDEPTVGIGTICRRQGTREAEVVVRRIASMGISLHAFGAKTTGLRAYHDVLQSSDSLAWSFNARKHPPLETCVGLHKSCANCARWALRWRTKLLINLDSAERQLRLGLSGGNTSSGWGFE